MTVQVPLTATLVAQVVDTKLKSVPATDDDVGTATTSAPMPVFVKVAVAVLFAPTWVAAKVGAERAAVWAWPVPDRLTEVAPPPLATIVIVAVRAPVVDGVKLPVMVQVALTATVVHVLDCAKSVAPALMLMFENTRVLVPVLVTVTVWVAEVEDTCWAAKVRLVADRDAEPWTPVATKLVVTEPAPVAKDSEPVRAVVDVGKNCTVTVQLPDKTTLAAHVVDTRLKSVPVTDAAVGAVTLSAPMPVLRRVATAVVVEPTCVVAKAMLLSEAVCPCPVPDSATLAIPPPLWVKLRVPAREPAALGVKLTLTVQVALMATVPQLLVWA